MDLSQVAQHYVPLYKSYMPSQMVESRAEHRYLHGLTFVAPTPSGQGAVLRHHATEPQVSSAKYMTTCKLRWMFDRVTRLMRWHPYL